MQSVCVEHLFAKQISFKMSYLVGFPKNDIFAPTSKKTSVIQTNPSPVPMELKPWPSKNAAGLTQLQLVIYIYAYV